MRACGKEVAVGAVRTGVKLMMLASFNPYRLSRTTCRDIPSRGSAEFGTLDCAGLGE
jgi:hypothetical protein